MDASGNVYVADQGNNAIKEIMAVNGSIPASPTIITLGTGFNQPYGVAVDAIGNVYVADTGNVAVKEILAVSGSIPASPTINTLGSGFTGPSGIAVDANGNVYVTDQGSNVVKEILAVSGSIPASPTILSLGSGFSFPTGVGVTPNGNIFVSDTYNRAAKEIQPGGVNVGSAAIGTATPPTITLTFTFHTGGTINAPAVLTQGAANLDFTDSSTGTCTTNGPSYSYNPGDTCTVDVTFNPTLPGPRHGAVQLINSGTAIGTAYVYGTGTGPQVTFSPGTQSMLGSNFNDPAGVAVDGSGNIFVADHDRGAVREILAADGSIRTFGSGVFNNPAGVAVDGSGNVFVADSGNYTVSEILAVNGSIPATPTINTLGGGFGFQAPNGVAVDGSGNVFVADMFNNAVEELPAAAGYTTVNPLGSGFNSPNSVSVDGSGNVFVADSLNNAIKEILAAGGYTTVNTLGSGFSYPVGVAVDSNGNVFVTDYSNNAVKEILATGGYTTINTLVSGLSGLNGLGVDGSGNVFVTDYFNTGVLKLDFADAPTLSFAATAVGSTSSDSPQTVTLTNSGNAALTFPVPTMGFNPSVAAGFTLGNGSTCPQLSSSSSTAALAPGASCTNLISFTPTSAGFINGSLVITNDALNAAAPGFATQSIALSGTGTASTPSITFTIPNHTYGDAPFTVSATSNSTGAFTYTVVSGPATVSGATVTVTGTGTVVLQASEAADSSYTASTQNATFTVAGGTPSIAFTVPNHTFGDAPFTVNATSNSTGAFTYSVVSGPATVSGSTVTLTGTGTALLQASEAADSNYTATTQNATFTVAGGTPSIVFTVPNHSYGDAPFTINATSNSTGAFTYSVVSGPATVSGATVTLTGAGTVVMQASEAADSNYTASTKNATFTVAGGTPTIVFTLPNHTYGDAPFTVNATSNSTGAITYSVVSGPAAVSGSTVTLTGTGTVVLQASETADSNYTASTKNATFTIAATTPTISFNVPNHTFGDAPFTVNATSNSTGAITYSVVSGPATVSGATVSLTGAGTVVLQASQAAIGNYAPATATVTFTVGASIGISASSGTGSNSGTATVAPGGAAIFSLMFTPGGATTYPDALTFSASGLPTGATAIFSPAMISAGSPATPVTLNIQTRTQTARSEKPASGRPWATVALGFLLLPLAGMKSARRLWQMPVLLALVVLSLGTVLGLTGCGSQSTPPASFTVTVTATDTTTNAHTSTNLTLTIQ